MCNSTRNLLPDDNFTESVLPCLISNSVWLMLQVILQLLMRLCPTNPRIPASHLQITTARDTSTVSKSWFVLPDFLNCVYVLTSVIDYNSWTYRWGRQNFELPCMLSLRNNLQAYFFSYIGIWNIWRPAKAISSQLYFCSLPCKC